MVQGRIDEGGLARLRARIGVELRIWHYNEVATRDAIRHFCDGIGDENPLFRDPEYAARSPWGSIVAPGCFLYSVHYPMGGGGGLPGVHGFHAGNDWHWYLPIREGDAIQVSERLTDVVEKQSQSAGRSVITYAEAAYRNQRGALVATALGWSVRAERQAIKERGKHRGLTRATYTPAELRAIEEAYDREEVRGAAPRYWEEVKVGDELVPVVKGPLNMTDMIAFISGTFGGKLAGRGGAHGIGLRYRRRHPAWSYVDPETGVVDKPEMVHAADTLAQDIGITIAYDYGAQRPCWLGHLLANWMGDGGFLKRLRIEIRGFNMLGDTTWCRGRVVAKRIEGDEHLVELEVWAENQRRQRTAPGQATVALPSREKGTGPALRLLG
jgi:acyl dehydratase